MREETYQLNSDIGNTHTISTQWEQYIYIYNTNIFILYLFFKMSDTKYYTLDIRIWCVIIVSLYYYKVFP